MRWLGALLLIASGAAVGYGKNAELRRQITLLGELMALIGVVEREIRQRGTPLPQILRGYRGQIGLPAEQLAKELEQGRALERAAEPWLAGMEAQTARILRQLCGLLGKYDSPTQAAACAQAVEQLTFRKEELQRQLAEKGQLYRTVPLTLGLLAALVLL